MFKDILPTRDLRAIFATVQAIYNEEKECWEVSIAQHETYKNIYSDCLCFMQRTGDVKVDDCDDYVIADAFLHMNGTDVQKIFNAHINPIVE